MMRGQAVLGSRRTGLVTSAVAALSIGALMSGCGGDEHGVSSPPAEAAGFHPKDVAPDVFGDVPTGKQSL
jgi:hypothetical protein